MNTLPEDILIKESADNDVHAFYEKVRSKENPDDPQDDIDGGSASDDPIDYSHLIANEAFIGETPYDAIKEGIANQFSNYVATEDRTNYVDTFYLELKESYEALDDDEEFHIEEKQEVLDKISSEFIQFMYDKFRQRLSLSLMDIENEEQDQDAIEYSIKTLYEFFIINARKNFLNAIYRDIKKKIPSLIEDDKQYFDTVHQMLLSYSPVIIAMGPMEFIASCKFEDDDELPSDVINLFNTGRVNGNFLRKYSPKLYENDDLEIDIINHVTLAQQLRRDLTNGGSETE